MDLVCNGLGPCGPGVLSGLRSREATLGVCHFFVHSDKILNEAVQTHVRSVLGQADFLTLILVLSMESHNESALNNCCTCKVCKSIKQFYEKHPDARRTYTKRYYQRHRGAILLAQAFARYQNGHTCQRRTLKRLLDAGFPVKLPYNAWQTDDNRIGSSETSDGIEVPSLHLGAFTGIQVS